MSIQKYYKASKMLKLSERSGLVDESKEYKNRSQQIQSKH